MGREDGVMATGSVCIRGADRLHRPPTAWT